MYVVTQVSRKTGDQASDVIWRALKDAWRAKFGSDPEPGELSVRDVQQLTLDEPSLNAKAASFWEGSSILKRAQRAESVLRDARVLWVDDHPEWNRLERQFLETFGLRIVTVETTRSAVACAQAEPFDLIISDIARGEAQQEGIDALPALKAAAPTLPVIFYVGSVERGGAPEGAFGITAKPDELLHLCLDAIERSA